MFGIQAPAVSKVSDIRDSVIVLVHVTKFFFQPWKCFNIFRRPVGSLSAPWKKAVTQAQDYFQKLGSEEFEHSSESSSQKFKLPSGKLLLQ